MKANSITDNCMMNVVLEVKDSGASAGETLEEHRKYLKGLLNGQPSHKQFADFMNLMKLTNLAVKTRFIPEPCMRHVNMEAKESAEKSVAAPSVTVTSLEWTRRSPRGEVHQPSCQPQARLSWFEDQLNYCLAAAKRRRSHISTKSEITDISAVSISNVLQAFFPV